MTKAERSEARSSRTMIWIALLAIAVFGVVAAVVASSWWPLIAVGGLALPMIPARTTSTRR